MNIISDSFLVYFYAGLGLGFLRGLKATLGNSCYPPQVSKAYALCQSKLKHLMHMRRGVQGGALYDIFNAKSLPKFVQYEKLTEQWQPARTGGSGRSTAGWVLKQPLNQNMNIRVAHFN